jgi:protein gp37
MAENSAIAWTDHTFSPLWGCRKVSAGCANCYADAFAHRLGKDCFGNAPRRTFGDAHWAAPRKWDAAAGKVGERARVFCGSMCDVLEDHPAWDGQRERLWALIRETPNLDWLLLTKRAHRLGIIPRDVAEMCWLGVTVEDQRAADERVPWLLDSPARVRFLSCEPLLGAVDLTRWMPSGYVGSCGGQDAFDCPISWVIAGSESGPRARPMGEEWVRGLRDQCVSAGTAFFFKQRLDKGRKVEMPLLDGRRWVEFPVPE